MKEILDQLNEAMTGSDVSTDQVLDRINQLDWKLYENDQRVKDELAGVLQRWEARREVLGGMIVEAADAVSGQAAIEPLKETPPALPPVGEGLAVGEHYSVNDNVEPLPPFLNRQAQR